MENGQAFFLAEEVLNWDDCSARQLDNENPVFHYVDSSAVGTFRHSPDPATNSRFATVSPLGPIVIDKYTGCQSCSSTVLRQRKYDVGSITGIRLTPRPCGECGRGSTLLWRFARTRG